MRFLPGRCAVSLLAGLWGKRGPDGEMTMRVIIMYRRGARRLLRRVRILEKGWRYIQSAQAAE